MQNAGGDKPAPLQYSHLTSGQRGGIIKEIKNLKFKIKNFGLSFYITIKNQNPKIFEKL